MTITSQTISPSCPAALPVPGELEVRVLTSLAAAEQLAAELDAVNAQSARPCPFSTWAFLKTFVTYDEFGALEHGAELRLVCVFDGGSLVGYLPLKLAAAEFWGLGYKKLDLLVTRDADRPHLVARAGYLERVRRAVVRHLWEVEREWDLLELWDQEAPGELLAPLEVEAGGFYTRRLPCHEIAHIALGYGSLAEYFRALRKKFRNNVARNARRLFSAGEVAWLWAEGAAAAELFPAYAELETRSWKQAIGGTIARHPRRMAFFRALFDAEQAMRLKVGLLTLDGLPVAGVLAGVHGDTLYALHIAFDEGFADLAPGLLLLLLVVRQGILGKYAAVNLLHGSTHYKDRWLAESRSTVIVQHIRRKSPAYARARLGDLKRLASSMWEDGHDSGRYNRAKRQLEREAKVARAADRESPRRALASILAKGIEVRRELGRALADALPFSVERLGEAGRAARPTTSRGPAFVSHLGHRPVVAVFDPDAPPTLAIARSLGRAGVRVEVYGPQRLSVVGASRYAAAYHSCPELDDPVAFVPWLENRVRRGDIELVAPTSDVVAYYLAEVRELFPPAVQAALADREAVLGALFKDRFAARCAAVGQPTPFTACPSSREEAVALAGELPYPVILKPRSHVGVGLSRGEVLHNPAELLARFVPYALPERVAPIAARYPELRWPIIQAYVPGALDNLFSVSGVLGEDGAVLASAVSKKTAQWPPTLGIGTTFEGHDDEACRSAGVLAVQRLLGRGLFEIELILKPETGEYLAIDLNPRAYGQIALDIARGNDLPRLWYGLATGEATPAAPPAPRAGRWVHSIPFHVGAWVKLMKGPERLGRARAYVEALRSSPAPVDVVNDVRDPLPTLLFAAKMLRHPGGLIRPFLADEGGGAA